MLAVAIASGTAASAQLKSRASPVHCGPFACPPRPSPGKLPSEEALAIGRKLVWILDNRAVARRNSELVRLAQAKEPPKPPEPAYPDGPIRAYGPPELSNAPAWGIVLQQRLIDHAALAYARRFTTAELKQMLAFFESPAAKKYLEDRAIGADEWVEMELRNPMTEDDLWSVACGWQVPREVEDAPHHEFARLHPPMDFPLPPRPAWCAEEERARAAAP